ncbi:MAG: uroporphyrinogen-III synthase, partial [Bdellovibrionota bacterium]
AEGLVAYFKKQRMKGKRVLIPRALEAREVLPEALAQMDARVEVAPVYQSVLPKSGGKELRARIEAGEVDLITFASSSTVKNFFQLVGKQLVPVIKEKCRIAAIGPITAATIEEYGLPIHIQPKKYTIPALVEAITTHYGKHG